MHNYTGATIVAYKIYKVNASYARFVFDFAVQSTPYIW